MENISNDAPNVIIDRASNWTPEVGSSMLIKFEGTQQDYKCWLVGMAQEDFLAFKIPRIPGARELIKRNAPVTVRFLSHGVVYGFTTSIINHVTSPCPIVFTHYPFSVEMIALRKAKRLHCHTPCVIYNEEDEFKAFIVDLSAEGCRINCLLSDNKKILDIATQSLVILDFKLCGEEEDTVLRGKVRHITSSKVRVSLGIQFENTDPAVKEHLEAYILNARKYC